VTNAADNLKFVFDGKTPGTLNERRNLGASFMSNQLFNMLTVHAGVFNAAAPGPKNGTTPLSEQPTFDLSGELNFQNRFTVSAAMIYENMTETNTTTSKPETYGASMYGVGLGANLPGFKANLTHARGAPLYKKGTRLAKVNKAENESVEGSNLWLETQAWGVHFGGFYGMETGKLSQKEGRTDKTGAVAKNVDEIATGYGVHVGYDWNDVELIFEYGTENLAYDGIEVSNKDYIGVAANLNWAS
jgi:hypothetical protein